MDTKNKAFYKDFDIRGEKNGEETSDSCADDCTAGHEYFPRNGNQLSGRQTEISGCAARRQKKTERKFFW